MQVNKHHTSDCTDFVLVKERVAYYEHRHSVIDKNNILQEVIAVEGETRNIQISHCLHHKGAKNHIHDTWQIKDSA